MGESELPGANEGTTVFSFRLLHTIIHIKIHIILHKTIHIIIHTSACEHCVAHTSTAFRNQEQGRTFHADNIYFSRSSDIQHCTTLFRFSPF